MHLCALHPLISLISRHTTHSGVTPSGDIDGCHMQVMNDVINKVYEQDFDGAKVFKDYEQGLASLQNVISAASPGEHFQLPPQDSSQLKQVTYCSAVPCFFFLP